MFESKPGYSVLGLTHFSQCLSPPRTINECQCHSRFGPPREFGPHVPSSPPCKIHPRIRAFFTASIQNLSLLLSQYGNLILLFYRTKTQEVPGVQIRYDTGELSKKPYEMFQRGEGRGVRGTTAIRISSGSAVYMVRVQTYQYRHVIALNLPNKLGVNNTHLY